MGPKTVLLGLSRAVLVVIVEPGLTDTYDFRMLSHFQQLRRGQLRFRRGFVRVNADRAPISSYRSAIPLIVSNSLTFVQIETIVLDAGLSGTFDRFI